MRVTVITLLALLALSACSAPRKSVAELEAPRSNAARAVETPAPDYPYTWRPRQLPKEPACYDAAMCYDEKREVCVLHGGRSWWWDARGSTWIWNGEMWWCKDQPMFNIYAHSHAMTYCHETESPLMWGGGLDYPHMMWSQWSSMTECRCDQSPDRLALASDPERNVVVAFGGLGSERKELRALYEIKHDSMKQVAFESGPEAQYNALMIYEPSLRACLLVDRVAAEDGKAIRTWTWDGLKWTERLTQGPEATIRGAQFLLYDTTRQCAVAICPGADSGTYEFWELRGSEWAKRTTTGAPSFRQGASAAYDQKRKTIVLHGGQMHLSDVLARDETWLCGENGVWRCANSPHAPRPGLNAACMCYDPSRKATVLIDELFESWNEHRKPLHFREWLWNGSQWSMHELPAEMPRYCQKTAVFDKRRNVMWVWFEAQKTSELWQCAHGVWSKAKRGALALPILGCVYNDGQGVVMLFHDDPKGPDNESRISAYSTWDGETLRTHETRGPKLDWYRSCVTYDRARNRVVVLGEWEDDYGAATWEFDGSEWLRHVPSVRPPGWSCEAVSYLGAVNRCVVFGGGAPMACDPHFVQEHWQWDGQKWECLQFANAPPGRSLALMAEDTDRGRLVLFGGLAYRRQYCDTWEYGPDRP